MLLLIWAGAFAFGDALAVIGVPLTAVGAGLAAGMAALLLWRRLAALAGTLAFVGLGLVLGQAAAAPPELPGALRRVLDSDSPADVVAVVERGPDPAPAGTRLVLSIETIGGVQARGRMVLRIARGATELLPGDRIAFQARLHEPRGTANFGLPDASLAARAAGVVALGGVQDAGRLRRLRGGATGPRAWAMRARRAMRRAVDAQLPPLPAAFLHTMVLGERSGLPPEVEEGFRAAGATHALSVSGLHLAAVAAVFLGGLRWLLVRLPRLPLWVDPASLAAVLALPAVAFYALLTGEAVATLRSAVMVAVGLGAVLFRRRASSPAAIGAAALVLLLPAPLLLFDISFQLTFASVAGIALLARRLGPGRQSAGGRRGRRAVRWLWRFAAATAAATAATAPLVAHSFGEVTPAALPGNLLLVPVVELGVVPLGLAGAGLSALHPALGHGPLWLAALAARLGLLLAAAFRAAAPVWLVRSPGPMETLGLTLGGVLLLLGIGLRPRGRRHLAVGLSLLVLAGASLGARALMRRFDPDLRVTFIDVGQGDSVLVELPGGATMLIDGGGAYDASFDPGARIVEPFLRARGISALDVVVLTHAHPDHMNGLQRIMQRFPVREFWFNGGESDRPDVAALLRTAADHKVVVGAPAPLQAGAARVVALGPWLDGHIAAPPGLSANNSSLVLRLAFGGRAVLLTGDIDEEGEGELIGAAAGLAGRELSSDVLKVAHHGSRTSTGVELLDAVSPSWAVISVGWRNRYHFPCDEVLLRLRSRGVRILRTDLHGAVTVRFAADGRMDATCARGCR